MTIAPMIYPVLVQVLLTFALMLVLLVKRIGAARGRRYKLRDIAVNSSNYPSDILKFGNSHSNQFELPVLFYLISIVLMIKGLGDNGIYLMLAWFFVATRLVHAFIHITSNHVIRRFYAFLVGAIALFIMWIMLAFELLVILNSP